jgi:hypothetical protein
LVRIEEQASDILFVALIDYRQEVAFGNSEGSGFGGQGSGNARYFFTET